MEHPVSAFERFLHTHDLFYPVIDAQQIDIQSTGIADNAQDRHIDADNLVDLKAVINQPVFDFLTFLQRCAWFHYNNHFLFSPFDLYA